MRAKYGENRHRISLLDAEWVEVFNGVKQPTPDLIHAGPVDVNREAELKAPFGGGCGGLFVGKIISHQIRTCR
jgi:hypothetical protein